MGGPSVAGRPRNGSRIACGRRAPEVASPMPRTPYVEVPMNARDIMTSNPTAP